MLIHILFNYTFSGFGKLPEVIYQVLEEPVKQDEIQGGEPEVPQSLEEFVAAMKDSRPDAETFAVKLKAMVLLCSLFTHLGEH